MKNYVFLITTSLTLASCGGDSSSLTINDVSPNVSVSQSSRIVFDPGAGNLALPNDLLFAGTLDGTLEPPDETAARAMIAANIEDGVEGAEEAQIDLTNPGIALGGVDGWSTQFPMRISVDMVDSSTTIDAATVGPESVLLIETNCGLGLTGCSSFSVVDYGPAGYIAVAGEDTITIVPTIPLNPSTSYIVGITNTVLDSNGVALAPSTTYESVTVPTSELDLPDGTSFAGIQDAVNGYEGIIAVAAGVDPNSFIYTASWTTTSAGDVVASTMGAYYNPLAPLYTPTINSIAPHPVFTTTADFNAQLPGIADVYLGTVTLPYFLASPTTDNPAAPLEERFMALCDNGVLLSQADEAVLAAGTPGENAATCQALGLADLGLDLERYVTRFNPVPAVQSDVDVEVIITVPNAMSGEAGPFPIVMFQHGITASKETVLAVADALAAQGYAAIAIDMVLHGDRGFDIDGDGSNMGDMDINASRPDGVTSFLNIQSLLTGKDNLRQASIDLLGLRNALLRPLAFDVDATLSDADFDRSEAKFIGMSLGGMVGVEFTAISASLGEPFGGPLDAAALSVPGGGIAPLLFDSAAFGQIIQGGILGGAGIDPSADPEAAGAALASFAFAAQTIVEGADPNNFAAGAAAATPTYMSLVIGDQVIPNQSEFGGLAFGGGEPLIRLLGLTQQSFADTPSDSGFVRFSEGSHGSLLDPTDGVVVTQEMQAQIATFIAGGGVDVTDAGVVE